MAEIPARRTRGLSRLSRILPKAAEKALARHGFPSLELITQWPRIIGPQLARQSRPGRIIRGPDGSTFVIQVDGAAALKLQHLAPEILSRVNAYLGGVPIDRLKLVQTRLARPAPEPAPVNRPVAPQTRAAIEDGVARVKDPELRDRLRAIGTRLAARANAPRRGG